MRFEPGNAQSVGGRSEQQDSFGFSDLENQVLTGRTGFLGVVADGMGGLASGREASLAAVSTFIGAYSRATTHDSVPEKLMACLTEANRSVVSLRTAEDPDRAVGSTLAAMSFSDRELHWLAVGDTRIYLVRDSKAVQLTQDHDYRRQLSRDLVEGHGSRADVDEHPQARHLTSYLGQEAPEEVDRTLHPFQLESGDVVVACTDGVYRGAPLEAIGAAFGGSVQDGCERLVESVVGDGLPNQDNATVIAVRCTASAPGAGGRRAAGWAMLSLLLALQLALFGGAGWWLASDRGRTDAQRLEAGRNR